MRKIGIIIGSDSDLPQMQAGLDYLLEKERGEKIKVIAVDTYSIHRHTLAALGILNAYSSMPPDQMPDALIIGAGWANHLTGCADAFLRYTLKNDKILVIGVAFADENDEKYTLAAELSITEVPGSQVIFTNAEGKKFIPPQGFLLACQFAAEADLPKIKLSQPKPTERRTLYDAYKKAFLMNNERKKEEK